MEKPWLQHYDPGVPESLDYPEQTIEQMLADCAAATPDAVLTVYKGAKLTYEQVNAEVDRLTAGLQQLGVKRGDRVALHLPNCPQFVIAYHAVLRAGGIVVPCNHLYVARELEHQLNDSGSEIMITFSMKYPTIREIRGNTSIRQVIVAKVKTYFPPLLRLLFTLLMEKKKGHALDISGEADTLWFQDVLGSGSESPHPVEVDT